MLFCCAISPAHTADGSYNLQISTNVNYCVLHIINEKSYTCAINNRFLFFVFVVFPVTCQVRANEHGNSDAVAVLPFACLLTVTDKQGGKVKINSPGAQPSCYHPGGDLSYAARL